MLPDFSPVLSLVAGLILLLLCGEFLVRGAVSLSGNFKISTMVVGITVVSFGTSVPELVVSMEAAFGGHPDISVGNVVGSNIANIGLVLALTILILPFRVQTGKVLSDWIFMMAVSLLLIAVSSIGGHTITRPEGLLFTFLLVLFVWYSLRSSSRQSKKEKDEIVKPKYHVAVSILIIAVASVGLVFGANFLIAGATKIAESMNVSERVISVSVVAFGTSLPELATSVIAAYRKESEISLGNIIGSNIFNTLGILGITASVKPITVNPAMVSFDMVWMIGFALILFLMALPLKGSILSRWKGVALMIFYSLYIYLVFS